MVLEKLNDHVFPFKWANLEYFPESEAFKKEIYLSNWQGDLITGLTALFEDLFCDIKDDVYVYNDSWGDFCLETWNIQRDDYNYTLHDKSSVVRNYLAMLEESQIEPDYSGSCRCLNWDAFLTIVLKCIISGQAPYSPIFYSGLDDFLFYFHHSGSIGLYYRDGCNKRIRKILETSDKKYLVV